jgi:hypothetical protein
VAEKQFTKDNPVKAGIRGSMPLYSQIPNGQGTMWLQTIIYLIIMDRKRIKKQPLLVYSVKVNDTEGKLREQTNVSQSQKIREKLEALFAPRIIMA